MMSEPTLEQIATETADTTIAGADAILASHLLTLIEQSDDHGRRLDSHNRVMESIVRRVRALEEQARPFQEDGHLAGSWCDHGFRREDDPQWRPGMAQCAQCAAVDWKQRAETAERERDNALEAIDHVTDEREATERELVAARASVERLRGYARHAVNCDGDHPSGHYDCTCGLTAALEDA